jgi:hypothetical protein
MAHHGIHESFQTPGSHFLKRVSSCILCFALPLFFNPCLRADVTLVTTFESGGAAGVDVSGSNQWRIHGSRARWDRRMSAKDARHAFKLSLHDRSCLIADLKRAIVKEINVENGQSSEIPFPDWKAYADQRQREENPFLDPNADRSTATHGRFTILPSTETALLGGSACRKIAYEISYDLKEPGVRTRKRCRILSTFWMAEATPVSTQAKTEVEAFFSVFEEKTGDRTRFSNPLTLGSHAWAEGNAGKTSELAALMNQLENEVRRLQGIPVQTEMETSLDREPAFWFRVELKTLSTAGVPSNVFNPKRAEEDNP